MKSSNLRSCGGMRAPDRVIVKFAEGVLPAAPPRPVESRHAFDAGLSKALDVILGSDAGKEIAGLSVRRYFEVSQEAWESLLCRAKACKPERTPPRFQDYVEVLVPKDLCADEIAAALCRRPREIVEHAYPLRGPGAPPLSDIMPSQLRASPRGVGAAAAWRCPGGEGDDVVLVDVEQGWYLEHGDLPQDIPVAGVNLQHRDHGGKVLGVLFAVDGGNKKTLGIARSAKPKLVSEWAGTLNGDHWQRTDAIVYATATTRPDEGDIVLLEAQTFGLQPVEVEDADWDVIRAAVDVGVIVVEAAGNSGALLSTSGKDSGAIMVAAAETGETSVRWPTSGHGERIDCYAPGSLVRSIAVPSGQAIVPDSDFLTGTSAAAAVVAGMAACIQGIAKRALGAPLSPERMRDVLRNSAYGSPVYETANDTTPIGHIPDLEKICRLEFGLYIAIDPALVHTFASPNTVSVTIQSVGTLPLTEATLSVYWAPASGSPPSDWQIVGSSDLNGVVPGASHTASFPWPPAAAPFAPFVLVGVVSDKGVTKIDPSIPSIPGRIAWSS